MGMTLDQEGSLFWRAARWVIEGDLAALDELLSQDSELARMRSPDSFRATLLHFVAANGVRDDYQRCPPNAPQIARRLLDAGADPDAVAASGGGGPNQTPLCLLVTSWPPFEAGLQEELVHLLVEGGAAVDGSMGNGAPLASALTFGYTGAAEALVAAGASCDCAFFAAGLGDLVRLRGLLELGVARALGSYAPVIDVPRASDMAAVVQEAFHFAVTHGRIEVMDWLLGQGASVDGATKGHHCELPTLQALFVRERQAFNWLVRRGADLDLRDGKRGQSAREALEA